MLSRQEADQLKALGYHGLRSLREAVESLERAMELLRHKAMCSRQGRGMWCDECEDADKALAAYDEPGEGAAGE